MNYNNVNGKEEKKVTSSIVGNIVDCDVSAVGAKETTSFISKYAKKMGNKKGNSKVIIIAACLIIIIIVGAVIFLNKGNSKKIEENKTENASIYETAYKTMGFEEDTKLTKLSCSKNIASENNKEITEKDTTVYYFNGNEIQTIIYHNEITLSDAYMDYYDTMYNAYDKSLESDYKYDNVDTNLSKDGNKMLTTIIIYGKRSGDNKLGMPIFANIDDAKKTSIDDGYTCS